METRVRKSYQIRALFRKNATLQMRQKATNICQALTPILCLLLIWLIKGLAEDQLEDNEDDPVELAAVPRFMNSPILPSFVLYNLVDGLSISNCEEWYYVDLKPNTTQIREFIGDLNLNYSNEVGGTGMLGKIPSYPCRSNMKRVPYFVRPMSSVNEDLYDTLEAINKNPMYHGQDSIYLPLLADGAVTFYEASNATLRYKAQINDQRFSSYHKNNGVTKLRIGGRDGFSLLTVTDGMLSLMDKVHNAYLQSVFPGSGLVSFVQYMPISVHVDQELYRLLNVMGASLYPICLSLLLPVFMYALVLEKEERLLELMKMNGLRILNYWLVNFIFDFMLYAVTILVFMLFGAYILELQFFTQTHKGILTCVFAGWGLSQIALAFFFQVFISKARTATVWGYLLSIWTVLWGVTLNLAVYPAPHHMPSYFYLYPHFAMTRAVYLLSYNCGYYKCIEDWHEVNDELTYCLLSLYLGGAVYMVIALYLNEIVPRQYGVPRHPLFCIKGREAAVDIPDDPLTSLEPEEELVSDERMTVHNIRPPFNDYPLIVKDLRKVYPATGGRDAKVAVKNMCLVVKEGELFGLLGPNGAGKTTLISMLTGLYPPDRGNAWVSGYDIKSHLDQVQLYMGVCPQFDVLWPELTVKETLLFYARLKGSSPAQEHSRVDRAIEEVYLTKFSDLKTRELSGGMRRRLSVAIALVGEPRIVFLDEPTTGLDPENRRQLWDILAKCKEGRAMVLTTHSMEEADVLCSRVAIVDQGVMKCIGPQVVLKSRFGGGYHLHLNAKKHSTEEQLTVLKDFLTTHLAQARLVTEFNGSLAYQVPRTSCKVSEIFKLLEEHKEELGIADWGISQSSLEDVFMRVVISE
jgi:ABC-type multidrug transport system ATPase subunit